MALIERCPCGKEFSSSDSSSKIFCDDCDGTTAAKEIEALRWAKLRLDEKVEELKARIEGLENRSFWDGRIG